MFCIFSHFSVDCRVESWSSSCGVFFICHFSDSYVNQKGPCACSIQFRLITYSEITQIFGGLSTLSWGLKQLPVRQASSACRGKTRHHDISPRGYITIRKKPSFRVFCVVAKASVWCSEWLLGSWLGVAMDQGFLLGWLGLKNVPWILGQEWPLFFLSVGDCFLAQSRLCFTFWVAPLRLFAFQPGLDLGPKIIPGLVYPTAHRFRPYVPGFQAPSWLLSVCN